MLRKTSYGKLKIGLVVMLSLLIMAPAYAGSTDLKATKRKKYQDDSVESMKERMERLEQERGEYQKTLAENSEKTVKLLEKILVKISKLVELEKEEE